ncbi:MAG TPA: MFS transporter [Patescibacteria group bacterium]|nr:MFS transporter [Patescibacteria group bacterium]
MSEVISKKDGRYPALKSLDFRYFWFGQFVSNIGTQMQIVALNWHIYVMTGSAIALGIIGLSRFIPVAIFATIGGSFADVHNRKHLQLVTQTLMALLSFVLAATTFMHTVSPFIIYTVTVLMAVITSFDLPARQALIPNLVDKQHLPSAMSLNFIMFQTSIILGPALAGFLIGGSGVGLIYLLNAISFISVIISILLLKNDGEPEGEKSTVSWAAIVEGLKFVRSKTLIWSTMLLDFFAGVFAAATVIMPIFAKEVLKVGPQGLGFLYAAPSVGAVLAGMYMAHTGTIKKQGVVLLTSVAIFGLATIAFGLSKNFMLSLLFLSFVGAGDSVSTVIRNVIRNIETPDYIRGRMTSINMIFFMGGPQLGEFEAGLVAAAVGGPLSVVLGGVGTLVVVGATTVLVPTLRNYTNHEDHRTS